MSHIVDSTRTGPAHHDPFAEGAIECIIDTTEAQRELWLADQLGLKASLAFNESLRLRLRGKLDVPALKAALDQLVARHESLRATFSPDGMRMLVSEARPLTLGQYGLGGLDAAAQAQRLEDAAQAAVLTPFMLERGPLFRADLYSLAAEDHLLQLSAHHAVCDGWSWGVIVDDLARLYAMQAGAASPAPEAPARYADYAQAERQEYDSAALQPHIDYWLARLAGGSLPVLELPLDHPRPATRDFASARADRTLPADAVAALRGTASSTGASLFATLFAGFAALLHRLGEQDDLVIGIAAAGQLARDMPRLVGHCVNLLPLRVAVDAALPFDALVRQSSGLLLDAFEHQALGLGTLLKKLAVPRDPSRLPLVNVLFNLDPDLAPGTGRFGDLALTQDSIARHHENFELFLNITPLPNGALQMQAQYSRSLFEHDSIERWLSLYECLLRNAAQTPTLPVGQIALPCPEDLRTQAAWQPAPTPLDGPALMHAGFARQAARDPARAALRHGTGCWSYGQIDALSNQLARALRARGIGRGQHVGLCLARGVDMVTALLAVLKSGAAYVPLDPAFPPARLADYAEDAMLDLLLCHASAAACAPSRWRADAVARTLCIDQDLAWWQESTTALAPHALDAQPEDPAYVIYTSGSTGRPKGVRVPHRAVANFLQSMQAAPGIGAGDRVAAITTLSFDIAVAELILPLAAGAEIVLADRETAMDGERLLALLHDNAITVLQATPGTWRMLLDTPWQGTLALRGWIGGESVPPDLARTLLGRTAQLWNVYGPTETTVWSTVWRMDHERIARHGVAIGRPIANTCVWILDRQSQPCPIGVPGEICIGGQGVALGYLDRPELNAERFVTVPIGGVPTRLYRTGDRGRWGPDGLLEHQGRLDFQIKVRGHRIEPGEIEARCNEVSGVTRSVVIAREDRPGDVRLVAYLCTADGAPMDRATLVEHLRERLPQYMLPQHVLTLAALPVLPNGKIDRKALPAPIHAAPSAEHPGEHPAAPRIAPRTPREALVLKHMEQILQLPGISVDDDFFALGGHSLLAARLATQLSAALQSRVPLNAVFEAPTAARLARATEALEQGPPVKASRITRRIDRSRAPLTSEQARMRFAQELHPQSTAFNTPSAHRLRGPLERTLFEQAFQQVVDRQDALRTTIVREGEDWVAHISDSVRYPFPFEDLRSIAPPERETGLQARIQAAIDTPIDPTAPPLFRVALYQLDAQEHVFFFMVHHIVWDGYSFDLLYREMAAAYGARVAPATAPLPPLRLAHGDYAQWHGQWLVGQEAQAQRAHWHRRFEALAPLVPMPADFAGPRDTPSRGGICKLAITRQTVEALRRTAQQANATLNMLTMGAYAVVLASATGSPLVGIGMPVRGRLDADLDDVMGLFIGLVPVMLEVRPQDRFVDFLAAIRTEMTQALAHQELPFEQISHEASAAQRRTGLYQSAFSFQDARERPIGWGPLRHTRLPVFQHGLTDPLGLWLVDHPAGMNGGLVYDTQLYRSERAQAMHAHFEQILAAVTADPTVRLGTLAEGAHRAQHTGSAPLSRERDGQAAMILPEEARLAQVWAEVLGLDVNDIRPGDNFFDLGGDSLLTMRAVRQAEQALGFRVEARRYVFESLAQLSAPPASAMPVPPPPVPSQRGLLGRMMSAFGRK